ncbi:Hypothetical protein NTJ_15527 [Nesidiocoris tenuis]|uniref:Uncharacterized protein n=1 Tax=Nesidiocoris tenuis TaxID=355587 RepID=A0ABN7BEH1_9HEMI|nr:Hypothetical protein NTJ_15527 [Nesidiocoris tenuis]
MGDIVISPRLLLPVTGVGQSENPVNTPDKSRLESDVDVGDPGNLLHHCRRRPNGPAGNGLCFQSFLSAKVQLKVER